MVCRGLPLFLCNKFLIMDRKYFLSLMGLGATGLFFKPNIEVFNNKSYENRHFQVFIAEPSTIEKTYKDAVEKLKYIDIIIPTPLLIKSLYTKEIIQNCIFQN